MKKIIKVVLCFVLFIFIVFFVVGSISYLYEINNYYLEQKYNISSGEINLLAVSVDENESSNGFGSLASLNLEIRKSDEERVFIETEPIVKLDTQISTKFAKDIACDYIIDKKIDLLLMNSSGIWNSNCDYQDFIYSFDSNAYYLAGPSASSAVAVLTISVVEGIPIRKDIVMTGTLQTGGYIGAVSGIKEKIDVAKINKMNKVLISSGTENLTDLIDYGKTIGIRVIDIKNLDDAMKEFVDDLDYVEFYNSIEQLSENKNITDSFYFEIMNNISKDMLTKSENKFNNLIETEKYENYYLMQKVSLNEIHKEHENKNLYSSASYSFVGLTNIGTFEILSSKFPKIMESIDDELLNTSSRFIFPIKIDKFEEISNNDLVEYKTKIKKLIQEKIIEYKFKYDDEKAKYSYPNELTSVEFEIYGTILERLDNIEKDLESLKGKEFDSLNNSLEVANEIIYSSYLISRIEQRFYTIEQWNKFLDENYFGISLSRKDLELFCDLKVNEAIEYINFIDLFYGIGVENRDEILKHQNKKEYLECIFKSTLAKADMEYFLDEIHNINNTLIIEKRIDSIKNDILISNIFDKYLKDNYNFDESFPIVAYNYYEYSNVLKSGDPELALIYSEYAIELNKLHNEFNRILIGKILDAKSVDEKIISMDNWFLIKLYVFIGMFVSLFIGMIIGFSIKKTTKVKKKNRISIKKRI